MVGIIDYGVGNLFSLVSAFKSLGEQVIVSGDPNILAQTDRLILPGVGAFSDAAAKLQQNGMDEWVRQQAAAGKPLLGICLGMQMLFERSYEYGEHSGLGILKGEVVPMIGCIPNELKIPHMGWNQLQLVNRDSKLLANVKDGEYVYFVHSYFADGCETSLAATTDYGRKLTAAVELGNVFGCQFHPEKSGKTGMRILEAFCKV